MICLPTKHLGARKLVKTCSCAPGSYWSLEVLVFEERGKPEYPEKNRSEQGREPTTTQPTYDTGTWSRTRATLVGGEHLHHCVIPAPPSSVHERRCLEGEHLCVLSVVKKAHDFCQREFGEVRDIRRDPLHSANATKTHTGSL